MKLTVDERVFTLFPDFNAGIVAMKGLDNLVPDRDIEAFLRHASLEAALLMKLRPLAADMGVRSYRQVLEKGAMSGVPAMEAVLRELGEGIAREAAAPAARGPGAVSGLIGDTALPRQNAVMDLVRGAELQFRLPVLAFDVGSGSEAVALRPAGEEDRFLTVDGAEEGLDAEELIFAMGNRAAVRHFFCEIGAAGAVTPETRNLLVVIPCFAQTRRKAMSVRNELVRRLKDSFGRMAESAWIDSANREFVSDI